MKQETRQRPFRGSIFMIINSNCKIAAMGRYLPERKMTNIDFEKIVDTDDAWIVKRTGIHNRYLSAAGEFSSDMAIRAVEDLVRKDSTSLRGVDMIITTCLVPDHLTPSVSAIVAGRFGLHSAGTYDLHAACSGFAYALITANAMIASGQANKVLLISSETPSKVTDYTDRGTCILFGDAAVATLIEKDTVTRKFAAGYGTDGDLADKVYCSLFSSSVNGTQLKKERYIEQDGQAIYTYVVKNICDHMKTLMQEADMTVEEIDWFIPHSANLRLINALCDRLGFEKKKMLTSVEQYGNTSSASIPLSIALAQDDGRLKRGDRLLVYGFGGGLTYAGAIFEW